MSESRERSPFPAVGGHPGFDLVDTVHWRLDSSRAIDTLADFDDVVAWCAQMGVVDDDALAAAAAADPDAAAREFRAVVALREAIYEAVFTSSESAAHLIAEEYVAGRGRSTLQHDAGAASWRWRVPGLRAGPLDASSNAMPGATSASASMPIAPARRTSGVADVQSFSTVDGTTHMYVSTRVSNPDEQIERATDLMHRLIKQGFAVVIEDTGPSSIDLRLKPA